MLQTLYLDFRGATSKGREGRKMEGKWREGSGEEGMWVEWKEMDAPLFQIPEYATAYECSWPCTGPDCGGRSSVPWRLATGSGWWSGHPASHGHSPHQPVLLRRPVWRSYTTREPAVLSRRLTQHIPCRLVLCQQYSSHSCTRYVPICDTSFSVKNKSSQLSVLLIKWRKKLLIDWLIDRSCLTLWRPLLPYGYSYKDFWRF